MQIQRYFSRVSHQAAFTMIELLIVIAILGILAVAVLAAINPIEQINRGRDTGSRSDAEQLLSAIDRYYAYKGYYPWTTNPNDTATLAWRGVAGETAINYGSGTIPAWLELDSPTGCSVLDKLSNGNADQTCTGNNELKRSYIDKITQSDFNHLYVYYNGLPGSSVYVCFLPQSGAFQDDATERCVDENGSGLPADLQGAADDICGGAVAYSCLP